MSGLWIWIWFDMFWFDPLRWPTLGGSTSHPAGFFGLLCLGPTPWAWKKNENCARIWNWSRDIVMAHGWIAHLQRGEDPFPLDFPPKVMNSVGLRHGWRCSTSQEMMTGWPFRWAQNLQRWTWKWNQLLCLHMFPSRRNVVLLVDS